MYNHCLYESQIFETEISITNLQGPHKHLSYNNISISLKWLWKSVNFSVLHNKKYTLV